MAQNIHRAREYGLEIARLGAIPIIPHSMFSEFHGTLTDEFWIAATLKLMRLCDAVFFIPGWRTSQGEGEWKDAGKRGQPRFEGIADLMSWLQDGTRPPTPLA